jgi:hypothetical protein
MNTRTLLFVAGVLCLGTPIAPAQDTDRPVISVTAPQSQAAEPSQRGVFRVFRDGPTNTAVLVNWRLDGTALHGVDYQTISNRIYIPAGRRVAEVPVIPIDDNLVEGTETVIFRLLPPESSIAYYVVGAPAVATVFLGDNDGNQPPLVRLMQPTNQTVFPAGGNLRLVAEAHDPDGTVVLVEFFAGTNRLGAVQGPPTPMPPQPPFTLVWSNVPPGDHILRAVATDNRGAHASSEPLRVIAQTPQTIVTIHAPDPLATEPTSADSESDVAVFVVRRDRGLDLDLPVLLSVRGTAQNGVDYATIPERVVIPRGAATTEIVIRPRADNVIEGAESVVLGILPSPACMLAVWPPPPECYRIGEPAVAEARILESPANNRPPMVELVRPNEGISIPVGRPIGLLADTWDVDGYVTLVEFFSGTNKVGEVARHYIVPPPPGLHLAFHYNWSNAPLGRHALLARATDNHGATTLTRPRHISVVEAPPPPPTNPVPVISLVAVDSLAAEGTNCWRWPRLHLCADCPRTNCGPNFAVFAVRRQGPTNDSLRVHYRIGGTASNGVDYTELPGVAVIPAGERVARIVVQPVDDPLREGLETVLLALQPPPADVLPPPFLLSRQHRAAAVIVDNDADRPLSRPLANGMFHFQAEATDGSWLQVEASADLSTWVELGTCEVTDGSLHFVDPDADANGHRFYRVKPALPPELE